MLDLSQIFLNDISTEDLLVVLSSMFAVFFGFQHALMVFKR